MRRRTVLVTLVALSLAVGAAAPARAAPEDVANRVARNVMSPFCPGLSLHDCPSDASLELRREILAKARAGWSYERIVADLEAEYGADTVRATPPPGGLGLLTWALPVVALVAGAAIAVARGRRWSSARPGAETAPAIEASDEERARLDAELDRLRATR